MVNGPVVLLFEDLVFTSIGYELKAGATQKKTYNLTDVFDISQDGKYRLPQIALSMIKGAVAKAQSASYG